MAPLASTVVSSYEVAQSPGAGQATNRLAHREFLQDFDKLQDQFERQGATPSFIEQVHDKIREWMTAHILAIDIAA